MILNEQLKEKLLFFWPWSKMKERKCNTSFDSYVVASRHGIWVYIIIRSALLMVRNTEYCTETANAYVALNFKCLIVGAI